MRRSLSEPVSVPLWQPPLRRMPFDRNSALAAHRLLAEGTAVGGGRVSDFETWLCAFESDPEFDPQLCFVIADTQGAIAVCQCWNSAFIRHLVVHPRGQRQGIAERLLNLAFGAFAARGEGHVDLNVMESNIGARRLYERVGMRYVQRGELDPARAL
ncbi:MULTISPECIES: GNAT family N-acetyltransferase [unclassified Pseudomonas]|uniref:GNAT family N-acetyltransferase n=1 Tax=unclassified Pseudomonas TaxID=196821 RepID=UPI00211480C0|nr:MULTISPECIES: GNAT family N-acetyltransferase [unclassified Pseudomonas]